MRGLLRTLGQLTGLAMMVLGIFILLYGASKALQSNHTQVTNMNTTDTPQYPLVKADQLPPEGFLTNRVTTDDYETVVFIGGIVDGQRRTLSSNPPLSYRVPILKPTQGVGKSDVRPVGYYYHEYNLQRFGHLSIYVWTKLSFHDLHERLLNTYENIAKNKREEIHIRLSLTTIEYFHGDLDRLFLSELQRLGYLKGFRYSVYFDEKLPLEVRANELREHLKSEGIVSIEQFDNPDEGFVEFILWK